MSASATASTTTTATTAPPSTDGATIPASVQQVLQFATLGNIHLGASITHTFSVPFSWTPGVGTAVKVLSPLDFTKVSRIARRYAFVTFRIPAFSVARVDATYTIAAAIIASDNAARLREPADFPDPVKSSDRISNESYVPPASQFAFVLEHEGASFDEVYKGVTTSARSLLVPTHPQLVSQDLFCALPPLQLAELALGVSGVSANHKLRGIITFELHCHGHGRVDVL
jgi:hypothetical protein